MLHNVQNINIDSLNIYKFKSHVKNNKKFSLTVTLGLRFLIKEKRKLKIKNNMLKNRGYFILLQKFHSRISNFEDKSFDSLR